MRAKIQAVWEILRGRPVAFRCLVREEAIIQPGGRDTALVVALMSPASGGQVMLADCEYDKALDIKRLREAMHRRFFADRLDDVRPNIKEVP